ncbi:hypothetical protein GE21DRAFT_1311155 [Neurospora crassa]|nr:hypothetical protein GE21DRAFT_1311155 [Neurospora crassa]
MAYILAFFLALCFLASLSSTPGVRVTDPQALKVGDTRGELNAELKKLDRVVNILSFKARYTYGGYTCSLPNGADLR